ncbi:hypothetical protein SLEP1_g58065 [Rubroshorea leprosula]|uniref:DUF4283 domain-containing protein n=1 Tax=Rubroshorea leprosula TaxID=152421 RepID=A0AAV5MPP3_9ROSI|nr:hypothetical protein SLEP1_g58065 [Rubroshorea leprosula]
MARARAREGAGFRVRFSTARDSGKGFSRQLPGYGRQFIGRMCILREEGTREAVVGLVLFRMSEVSNVFDKERKLNQIWIDSYRLKVKLAENVKRGEVVAGKLVAIEEGHSSNNDLRQSDMKKGSMAIEIMPDKEDVQLLEADVVPVNIADRVVEPSTEKDTEVVRLHSSPNLVLQFSPTEEEVAWLKKSMVAVGCLEEFFKCNSDLVESWFEWIHPTSLSTMPSRSRMVWLRFAGVPLKAWSERCFTELGALLGEVILVNEDTKSKSFLSEGRVLILSDMQSKIANRIVLVVNGESFPIAMSEEEWRMDPDWWEKRANHGRWELGGLRHEPEVEKKEGSSYCEGRRGRIFGKLVLHCPMAV